MIVEKGWPMYWHGGSTNAVTGGVGLVVEVGGGFIFSHDNGAVMDPRLSRSGDSSMETSYVAEPLIDRIGEISLYQTLLAETLDGILLVDGSLTIHFANPAIQRLFGYSPNDLIGESLLTLLPADSKEECRNALAEHVAIPPTSAPRDFVFTGEHKAGGEIEVELSLKPAPWIDHGYHIGIIRDVTVHKKRERELDRYRTVIDAVGDGIYQLDAAGNFVAVNPVIPDVTGYSQDDLIGEPVTTLLDAAGVQKSVRVIRELLESETDDVGVVEFDVYTADGQVIPVEDRIALLRSDGELRGTVGVVRDISDRKRREQELERQRNELAELNRINRVIREINETLVSATTRDEVEETVCRRLADSESYRGAWVGTVRPARTTLAPTTWAGIDDDSLPVFANPRHVKSEEQRTDTWCTLRVRRDLHEDASTPELSQHAATHGFRSMAAIPVRHRDTVYGILHLYSDRPDGFTERETTVLEELGELIGHAINAIDSKNLLHADTVVELEFSITGTESFFIDATRTLGCSVSLEGTVPASEDSHLQYVSLAGAPSDELIALADTATNIDIITVVSEHPEETLLLFHVSGASVVLTLSQAGARVKTATAEHGRATVTATVAPTADTGTVVDTVSRIFPHSELVACREVEHPVQTQREFRERVKDRLTDKQLRVLEAAYHGGYFARPRDISGSDLAASFDITGSTFHHHLQTGLAKVMRAMFEEEYDEPP